MKSSSSALVLLVAAAVLGAALPASVHAAELDASVGVNVGSIDLKTSGAHGGKGAIISNLRIVHDGKEIATSTMRLHLNGSASSTEDRRGPNDGPRERVASSSPHDGGPRMGGEQHEAKLTARGTAEIDARIKKLNAAIARLNQAERLSADAKATLVSQLTDQIKALTDLKASITSGTASSTLKDDVQSVTKAYRVYALVLPQAAITAAADRVVTIASQMAALSVKLDARIATAKTAGADVSAALTASADFSAKVLEAKSLALAAASSVDGLKPDNGDKNLLASNTAALKAAQEKIKTAETDLKAARADISIILRAVAGKGE